MNGLGKDDPHCGAWTTGQCPQPELCPLNQVRVGAAVRIKQLLTPPDVSNRLREMGLCEDQQVRLLSQRGNLICQVCNARLGINEELARSIWVEMVSAASARTG